MNLKRRLKFYSSRKGRKYFLKFLTKILLLTLAISMAVISLYIASTVANGAKKRVLYNDDFTVREEILDRLRQERPYVSDSFTVHKAFINGKYDKKLSLYKYSDGTVYIPLEYAEKKIGAGFTYYRQDGIYTMQLGSHTVFLREGCYDLVIDETKERLDGPLLYYKNKLLIPFRFLQVMGQKSQIYYSVYNVANSDGIFLNILLSSYQKYKGRIMAFTVKDGYVGYEDCVTGEFRPVRYTEANRIKSCDVSYDGKYALLGLNDKKCLLYFNEGIITNIKEFPDYATFNKSKDLIVWVSGGRSVFYDPKENIFQDSGTKYNIRTSMTSPDGKLKVRYDYNNGFGKIHVDNKGTEAGMEFGIGSYIPSEIFEDPGSVQWISDNTLIIKTGRDMRLFDFEAKEMAFFSLSGEDSAYIAH